MPPIINRVATFSFNKDDVKTSDLDTEFNNVATALNNLNAGTSTWDNVNATASKITNLTAAGNVAMGGFKITGLANGTAATDGAAFGQVPVVTAGQIVGTATNDNATAGNIGEYVVARTAYPTSFPATGVWGDAASISLTAGDWDVSATVLIAAQTAAGTTDIEMGISQTTGNSTTGLVLGDNWHTVPSPAATSTNDTMATIPAYRQSLASTTIIYLKIMAGYTGVVPKYGCRLSARRMR